MMSQMAIEKAIDIFRAHGGVMSLKSAAESGIHYRTLYEMRDNGILDQISRGKYRLDELPPLSNPDLAVIGLRVPRGVVCLISALSFYELTTQIPHEVYVAIERRSEKPRIKNPPIRVFRFSGPAFNEGIEDHNIDGINVRIYCTEKTIADCFKFRNKIGIDVAVEALKDYRRTPGFKPGELMKYAKICRVENVMMPYVQAVL